MQQRLHFGLPSLYLWIKCFEYLLHIAYRLEVKTWKIKSNSKLSASITGVDENLIKRFGIILRTITSGYEIDKEAFGYYAMNTAKFVYR